MSPSPHMTTAEAIALASTHLRSLGGHVFDVLSITKPVSSFAASNLAKVVSKLSPILGNLIEFNAVEFLNGAEEFKRDGRWVRQDPGFPDTIFQGSVEPAPGFEIKAWFPLATEITARFRNSQNHFDQDQTYVAVLAWLPQNLIYGKPSVIEVCVVSAKSVAAARDAHYFSPPDYLVIEPEDTSRRTRNLQQTNTNGYKWQGTTEQFKQASRIVGKWGKAGRQYSPTRDYQERLRELIARFPYRLDTNYAKMDRIAHPDIEAFKKRVLERQVQGRTISEWSRLLFRTEETELRRALSEQLGIVDRDAQDILE